MFKRNGGVKLKISCIEKKSYVTIDTKNSNFGIEVQKYIHVEHTEIYNKVQTMNRLHTTRDT